MKYGTPGVDHKSKKDRLGKKKPKSDAAEKALGNKIEKADYKGEDSKKFSKKEENLKGKQENS